VGDISSDLAVHLLIAAERFLLDRLKELSFRSSCSRKVRRMSLGPFVAQALGKGVATVHSEYCALHLTLLSLLGSSC
ncbi:unnamed protein product, partial [Effrenium voratum]